MSNETSKASINIGHHVIESIDVQGGYVTSAMLAFAGSLNCIIGGRGSGKSTLLALLRFALGLTVPPAFQKSHDTIVAATLGGGRVTVVARTRNGTRYKVSRAIGEDPIVTDENDNKVDVSLDSDLFRAEIYGQNEIEAIASDARSQLALIDKFVEAGGQIFAEQLAELDRLIAENGSELVRLGREIAVGVDRTHDLSTVTAAIADLRPAAGPAGEIVERAMKDRALRARERDFFTRAGTIVASIASEATRFGADVERLVATLSDPELEKGPNGEIVKALAAALDMVGRSVSEAVASVGGAVTAATDVVTSKRRTLDALHAKQDIAFAAIAAEHEADQGRLAERARLEVRRIELTTLARKLEHDRQAFAALRKERTELISRRHGVERAWWEGRRRACEGLTSALGGDVRVTVARGADTSRYEDLLLAILKGSGTRTAYIKQIAEAVRPDDLAACVLSNDLEPIIAADRTATGDKAERAKDLVDELRKSERVYEIEAAKLEDVPLIELRAGKRFKASSEVSMGQKCACILPIVLLHASGPLVVDQPEDNLDNAYIYNVLVKSVLTAKALRQLIFVTHNPNIPVLGEAERVFALESDGSRGWVDEQGTVDELRGTIERCLEGGSEAFRRRGIRYGHDVDGQKVDGRKAEP